MHPDFEHYKKDSKGLTKTLTARIPEELKASLELICELEDDNISSLILEGVARVVESRLKGNGLQEMSQAVTERRQKEDELLTAMHERSIQLFGPQA